MITVMVGRLEKTEIKIQSKIKASKPGLLFNLRH